MTVNEVAATVARILVESFGFEEAEARHRVNLWRARQHNLEADALQPLLAQMCPQDAQAELVRWILAGAEVEADLRASASDLRIKVEGDKSP